MSSDGENYQELQVRVLLDSGSDVFADGYHSLHARGVIKSVDSILPHVSHSVKSECGSYSIDVFLASLEVLDTLDDFDSPELSQVLVELEFLFPFFPSTTIVDPRVADYHTDIGNKRVSCLLFGRLEFHGFYFVIINLSSLNFYLVETVNKRKKVNLKQIYRNQTLI